MTTVQWRSPFLESQPVGFRYIDIDNNNNRNITGKDDRNTYNYRSNNNNDNDTDLRLAIDCVGGRRNCFADSNSSWLAGQSIGALQFLIPRGDLGFPSQAPRPSPPPPRHRHHHRHRLPVPLASAGMANRSSGMTFDQGGFDRDLWKKNYRIIELYVIGLLIAAGLLGNLLSLVVLKRDRQRRQSLLLLRALALADLSYLVFAALRYPARHLMPLFDSEAEWTSGSGAELSSPFYVRMQPFIFPCLKTTQTITIWMTVLVSVDRFAWVRFPQRALKAFNAVTRKRYAIVVCLLALLYNSPRFVDSKVFQLNLPCLSAAGLKGQTRESNVSVGYTVDRERSEFGEKNREQDWSRSCLDVNGVEINISSLVYDADECGTSTEDREEKEGNGSPLAGADPSEYRSGEVDNADDDGGGDGERNDHGDDDDDDDPRNVVSSPNASMLAEATTRVEVTSNRFQDFHSSRVTSRTENETSIRQVMPSTRRCLRRTIMTYRLSFSGPIYHNLYLDGMYLVFLYLLPLTSISCINFYLVYAIRISRVQRHQRFYASYKFAGKKITENCCHHGGRFRTANERRKDEEGVDADINKAADGRFNHSPPPNLGSHRFPVWQTMPRDKRATYSGCRYHNDCAANSSSGSCSSLVYSHNRNYLHHFQHQHQQQNQSLSQKNSHLYHQQCHCYYGQRRRPRYDYEPRSERLVNDDDRCDSRRHNQVTFNFDSQLKSEAVKAVGEVENNPRKDHIQKCSRNDDNTRQFTVWIPFRDRGRPLVNLTDPNSRPVLRLTGSELNATVVLVVVVVVFVACESLELVLRLMTFSQRNFGLQLLSSERLAFLALASELTMVLKSTLNFLIYVAFGRRFRSFLRKVCPIRFPVLSSTSFGFSPQQKQAVPQII